MCIRVSFCCIDRIMLHSLTRGLHNLCAIQLLRMKHVSPAEVHRNSGNLSLVGVQDFWLLQLYDFRFEKIKSSKLVRFLGDHIFYWSPYLTCLIHHLSSFFKIGRNI